MTARCSRFVSRNHHGHVVEASRFVREVDEAPARCFRIRARPQSGPDPFVREHLRKTIGAKEQDVTRFERDVPDVGANARSGSPDRVCQNVPQRMPLYLLGREQSLTDEVLDDPMIARQLAESPAAEQVTAAVSDVSDEEVRAEAARDRQRRSHSGALRMFSGICD